MVLGREYDTLRSRNEAGERVSSDAMKGTDGMGPGTGGASYSSIFVFVVVLCRGCSCVRRAGAILQQATSAKRNGKKRKESLVDNTYTGTS